MMKKELARKLVYASLEKEDVAEGTPKRRTSACPNGGECPAPDDAGASAAGMAKAPLVPPDGGWGWMVVLGVSLSNATTTALLSVFGLLFFDTLAKMGVEMTGATVISSSMVSITNLSGLMTGPVMRHFTCRQVAMAGGILVALGMLFTSMATRLWHFFITYSILVGLGLGLLNPSTFVAVSTYFTSARGRAVGITMAGTGLGQMLMPHAVHYLLSEYSFRGTTLVLSAVALNSLVGAALYHPLRWHARPALTPPAAPLDAVELRPSNKRRAAGAHDVEAAERVPLALRRAGVATQGKMRSQTRLSSLTSLRDVAAIAEHHLPVVDPPLSNACNTQSKDALKFNEKDYVVLQKRAGGLPGCWRRAVRMFDLDLLREPRMVSLLVGLSAVYSAGVSFNILTPFFLASTVGLARADVALCMSLMAGCDISSRLLLPLLTDRLRVPARHTFLLGAVVLAAARSLMALQKSLMGVLVAGALCGFVRAANVINHNLAVSESVSPEKLPGALGLNMVMKGISITVLGFFTGWLRDRTGSFTICMHMLSLIVVLPMLAWLLEMWLTARRRRFRQAAPQATTPPPTPPPSPPLPPHTPPPTPTFQGETSPVGR